jgi:hypothetical protein
MRVGGRAVKRNGSVAGLAELADPSPLPLSLRERETRDSDLAGPAAATPQ